MNSFDMTSTTEMRRRGAFVGVVSFKIGEILLDRSIKSEPWDPFL